jgi:hypothetical protein
MAFKEKRMIVIHNNENKNNNIYLLQFAFLGLQSDCPLVVTALTTSPLSMPINCQPLCH